MTGGCRKLHNKKLIICTLYQILLGDEMMKWGRHGRDEQCTQNFKRKTWREQTTLKTFGVDGTIGSNIKVDPE